MDRVVQFVGETLLDAPTVHDRLRLAVPVPDYPDHVRLRVRASVAKEIALVVDLAIRDQSDGESFVYANPVWLKEPATGSR